MEMVGVLQNSGTTKRTLILGEFNFLEGVINKVNNGYNLAVFFGRNKWVR
jgi:hypothetical protein